MCFSLLEFYKPGGEGYPVIIDGVPLTGAHHNSEHVLYMYIILCEQFVGSCMFIIIRAEDYSTRILRLTFALQVPNWTKMCTSLNFFFKWPNIALLIN